jgi:hypothetical protein
MRPKCAPPELHRSRCTTFAVSGPQWNGPAMRRMNMGASRGHAVVGPLDQGVRPQFLHLADAVNVRCNSCSQRAKEQMTVSSRSSDFASPLSLGRRAIASLPELGVEPWPLRCVPHGQVQGPWKFLPRCPRRQARPQGEPSALCHVWLHTRLDLRPIGTANHSALSSFGDRIFSTSGRLLDRHFAYSWPTATPVRKPAL